MRSSSITAGRPSSQIVLVLSLMCLTLPAAADDNSALTEQVQTLQNQLTTMQQQDQQLQVELGQIQKQVAAKQQQPAQPTAIPGLPAVEAPIVITININGMPTEGNSAAKAVMIEFTDFECPDSGIYARTIYPEIRANYIDTGKIRYFYEDSPQPMYPHARPAAAAARCAGDQGKFWEMYDSLFANQSALDEPDFSDRAKSLRLNVKKFNDCLDSDKYDSTVRQGASLGKSVGVQQAPTFYFGTLRSDGSGIVDVNKKVVGDMSYAVYQHEIESELAPK
jgi:protein-disulfide isomerase